MNMERILRRFRTAYVGRHIRSQIVEHVGLEICDYGDETHYFVRVYFGENPPAGDSPETDMLQRVFSEIPPSADMLCKSWSGAVSVMKRHQPDLPWLLYDETKGE